MLRRVSAIITGSAELFANRDEALHPSALERHEQRPGYRPANLMEYLARTGRG